MYEEYYGLSRRAFQVTPDPLCYFESSTHSKALSYLGYGLAQEEGFIVITGDIGAGKSSLASYLMHTIDRARLTAATIFTSQLDAHDLVKMAAESFGIDTRGLEKASSVRAIEHFLQATARTGRRCLLIVDEAQNLSIGAVEELRMLSNIQLGATSLLQIFMLGQPAFRDRLFHAPEFEPLRHRVIATHHLTPMDETEVEPYIMHRLASAGWRGCPAFAPEVFQILFAETGGVPRKLNTLMNRVMLMGAVESLNFIDAPALREVIADITNQPFAYHAQMLGEPATIEASQGTAEESLPFEPSISLGSAELPRPGLPPATLELSAMHPAKSDIDLLEVQLIALQKRVAEQDDDLRRVVTTVLDWINKEGSSEAPLQQRSRAA